MSGAENHGGTIVTFYSYKGGVGRTMVLANVGVVLANWGYRVLLVDWDLEAPGLYEYLQPFARPTPLQGGVVDLLSEDDESYDAARWRSYVTHVVTPDETTILDFIPAGGSVGDYYERVQRLNLRESYANRQLGERIEGLRTAWKDEYDLILIDSRTGVSDIGGICTVQLPDLLCLCFTTNNQSFTGALEVARRANDQRSKSALDRARLLMLPLVTRFESSVEFSLVQEWEQRIALAFCLP
jgi:MinD-like ATPase involved in chromosome partitioning or flagellar assembly